MTFAVFESSCHLLLPDQSNHSKVEAILISALPKVTTSEHVELSSHTVLFLLNVKQGNCEYQLLKSSGLTWPGN